MNLKSFFYIFFKSKKIFKLPNKKNVLLFDLHGINLMKSLFNEKNFSILHTRKEVVNLPILIICLLNFKFKLYDYLFFYIKYVNPKIIVTHNDNYLVFYQLAKKLKDKKFIAIQRCVRSYHNDIYSIFEKYLKNDIHNKFCIEKFFVYNKQSQKIFEKYVHANYEIIGAATTNKIKNSFRNKENLISYVSNFSIKNINDANIYSGTTDVKTSEINLRTSKVIRLLGEYCVSRNLEFNILAKMSGVRGKRLVDLEKVFYERILKGIKFNLILNKSRDNFKELDRSKIVIGEVSNLLYESIFRGNKTFFLFAHPDHKILNTKKFGHLSGLASTGPFWSDYNNLSNVKKIIDNVLKMNDKEWQETASKFNPELIYFDENNSILKNYFKSLDLK